MAAAPVPYELKKLYLQELKKEAILDPVEQAKAKDDPTKNEEAMVITINLAEVKKGWTQELMKDLVKDYFEDASVKRAVIKKIFADVPKQYGEFEKMLLESFTKVTPSTEEGVPPVRTVDAESLYMIYLELVVDDMAWRGFKTDQGRGQLRFAYLNALSDEQKTALTKYIIETRMGIPAARERMESLYEVYQGRLHELEKKWIKEGKIQPKTYKSDIKCILVFAGDKTITGEVSGVLFQLSETLRNLNASMEEYGVGGREPWVISEAQTKEDFWLVVKDLGILVDMFAAQGIPWREQLEFDSISDAEFEKLMAKFTKTEKPLRHAEIMTRVLGKLEINRYVFTENDDKIGFDAASIFSRAMLNTVVSTSAGKDHVALVTSLVEQLWVSDELLQKGRYKSKAEVVRVFTAAVENFNDFKSFNVFDQMIVDNNNNNNEDLDELTNRFDKTFKRGTERSGVRAIPGKDGEKVQAPNDARRK